MKIKAKAFAKLNLCLGVTGKQNNGYHTIESVMQSVSLYDTVVINIIDKQTIKVSTNDEVLNGEENIAYKAAELYFEQAKISNGVEIFIEKRIPKAAGLGGGSADAAAVLLLLNKIYNKFEFNELSEIALKLGADVPFCLMGGTAFVEGIGEKIKKIKDVPPCAIVLIKDFKKASTKQMYEQIDNIGFSESNSSKFVLSAIKENNLEILCDNFYNDFYKVIKNEKTEEMLKVFKSYKAKGVGLSGAGPTLFAVFDNLANAENLYNNLKNQVEFVTVCEPTKNSIEIID